MKIKHSKDWLIAELRLALKVARACNNTKTHWHSRSPFAKKIRELLKIKTID